MAPYRRLESWVMLMMMNTIMMLNNNRLIDKEEVVISFCDNIFLRIYVRPKGWKK